MAKGTIHPNPIPVGPRPRANAVSTNTGRRAGPPTLFTTTEGTIVPNPRVAASDTAISVAIGMKGANTRRNGTRASA